MEAPRKGHSPWRANPFTESMNKERLCYLARVIVANHAHFNMKDGFDPYDAEIHVEEGKKPIPELVSDCNTSACIAGFCYLLENKKVEEEVGWPTVSRGARKWLDIDTEAAEWMFNRPLAVDADEKYLDTSTYSAIKSSGEGIRPSNDRQCFYSSWAYAQAAQDRILRFIEDEELKEQGM